MLTSAALSSQKLFLICLCLFIFAAGVRFLVWQNNKEEISQVQWGLTVDYKDDARALRSGDLNRFLFGTNPPTDAHILTHPPGYPIFLAAVESVFGENDSITIAQILLNALGPVLVFFIALKLFDLRTGIVAGFLSAVSPQLAYHSSTLLPDSLAVIPILLALFFLIRIYQSGRLKDAVFCGAALGLSCWLRSNTLLLPIFFSALILLLLAKKAAFRPVIILIVTFVMFIAPITIRNYVGFGKFIPLSLGSGVTFVVGIATNDKEGRFGLPASDVEVVETEAVKFDRPDYKRGLYDPDGIDRDGYRVRQGLAAVASDPVWFAGVAARRAGSFFRFERVPVIDDKAMRPENASGLTYYLNLPLRSFQKLFITAVFLPLFIFGIIFIYRQNRGREKLLILLVVPLYYVCFQSLLYTEYRFVLAMQYFELVIAAVFLVKLTQSLIKVLKRHRLAGS